MEGKICPLLVGGLIAVSPPAFAQAARSDWEKLSPRTAKDAQSYLCCMGERCAWYKHGCPAYPK